jgi:hypothetical protein
MEYQAFLTMCERVPSLKDRFEKAMTEKYIDHWKQFCRKALRNIDYFGDLSDLIIDDISYKVELANLTAGTEFIKAGKVCSEIHII